VNIAVTCPITVLNKSQFRTGHRAGNVLYEDLILKQICLMDGGCAVVRDLSCHALLNCAVRGHSSVYSRHVESHVVFNGASNVEEHVGGAL
jgi:hypothetical protein